VGIATRDRTPEDTAALADPMLRIEGDHPTGFCLSAGELDGSCATGSATFDWGCGGWRHMTGAEG
jgi:hypothetical protein